MKTGKHVHSLLPFDKIEQSALEQIESVSRLPFVRTMAIMPDVHMGYTMPIGGVALMEGVISPACVGYDIGCGMIYYETSIDVADVDEELLCDWFNRISMVIPIGAGKQHQKSVCNDYAGKRRRLQNDFIQ